MSHIRIKYYLALLLCSGAATAAPIFSPYVDLSLGTHWSSEYQDVEPMPLNTIGPENHINAFHLAFITDSGSCQPAWASQPTYSIADKWAQHLTDAMAKQGMEITISFGGFSGNDISMNCSVSQLTDVFKQTIATYQAKKLDFDIENSTVNVPNLIKALVPFQQQNPDIKLSFTLPVALDGLHANGKDVVSQAKEANLKFTVNIMAMDYGDEITGDMGEFAKQATNALHDYLKTLYPDNSDDELWQKIEITPMIGVNDKTVEEFTLPNARAIHDFALQHNIAGYAMWSFNRDKPCADKSVSISCSGNNLQKNDYDFVRAFLGVEK